VFQVAIFLGAFLLFLIQPLVAKQILPWFGGGPSVWSTVLLFFQVALVAGYAYAHIGRQWGVRRQAWTHGGLLVIALLTLSVLPSEAWKPEDASAPASRVLMVLAAHVGFPFVLLAATAPLLQDWHARLWPDRSPYRLYALSNAGSLLALLAYPFVIEPRLALPAQAVLWGGAFTLFVASCGWCGWLATGAGPRPSVGGAEADPAPAASRQVRWIALPACGAALLVATTSQLTQNIAPVPLLWVVPLAVYLVTYIIAFADRYPRRASLVAWVPVLIASGFVLRGTGFGSLTAQAAVHLTALFVGCLVCHGEVARLRPTARYLTDYYLALAIGGGVGGACVAIVAPAVFNSFLEFPLLLVLVTVVVAWGLFEVFGSPRRGLARTVTSIGLAAGCIAASALLLVRGPDPLRVVTASRNFYGVLSVVDDQPGAPQPVRRLYHGQILHGVQFRDPVLARKPTSYYVNGTGLDIALRDHPRRARGETLTIGVVGLGTGTVAAMAGPGDRIRFYELDPDVVRIAQSYFTYLRDTAATVDIVLGDGRLSIEREVRDPARQHVYDVLALDAFSGDAVPVHLLTREAFALYSRMLKEDGIVAINISNRFLDLRPVARALAASGGMEMRHVQRAKDAGPASTESDWLLLTANQTFLSRFLRRTTDDRQVLWTDSFSSILSVLQDQR
jgi:predicted membrane-bound spermidine synthase